MEIKTKTVNNISIIYLDDKSNIQLFDELEKLVSETINNFPDNHLLFNLKDLYFISSPGLKIYIISMNTLQQKEKRLKLCSVCDSVMKIFEIGELDIEFDFFETEDDAINQLLNPC